MVLTFVIVVVLLLSLMSGRVSLNFQQCQTERINFQSDQFTVLVAFCSFITVWGMITLIDCNSVISMSYQLFVMLVIVLFKILTLIDLNEI